MTGSAAATFPKPPLPVAGRALCALWWAWAQRTAGPAGHSALSGSVESFLEARGVVTLVFGL